MPRAPLAHIDPTGREHLLDDHLAAVGRLASQFAAAFESAEIARVAGLWHDLGKYAADFQEKILAANGFAAHLEPDEAQAAGAQRVDHSSAGAIHATNQAPGPLGQVLAFVIAGHHAGLANLDKLKKARLTKMDRLVAALHGGAPPHVLEASLPRELPFVPNSPGAKRRLEMWIRMLFSSLCDADFLDTEAFFNPWRAQVRENDLELEQLRAALQTRLDALERSDTEVNRARAEVRRACVERGAEARGFFSLTVPTGGGKTLASMAFALEHAVRHGLERVIVAIPFTSILEQSADAYRRAFGELGARAVLEHHSAFDPAKETPWNRVAAENWDAPVVVTTTAQLFDSLFSRRPGACRKLHRLAQSVVVLDEAQTLPPALLDPILDALGGLVHHYGSSVVVCTATQPALGRSVQLPLGFESVREIASPELRLFERLRRVEVRWPPAATTTYEELAIQIASRRDVLAIVHLRNDARRLTELVDVAADDRDTIHLSALMCPVHRREVLAHLLARRRGGQTARVVSTQLIEAGVDVDFPVVYRALAGADAIAQAAGRCNREGKLGRPGEVFIFKAETQPPRGVLRTGLQIFSGMLAHQPNLDPFAPSTFESYFGALYSISARDQKIQNWREQLRFEDVATFSLIEDGWSAPIVIRFGDADNALERVRHDGPTRQTLRALQGYTVAVPKKDREAWVETGSAETIGETVVAVARGVDAYDLRFGLSFEAMGTPAPHAYIV